MASAGGTAACFTATPGVRLWHVLLQAWLYALRRILPTSMAADLLSQVGAAPAALFIAKSCLNASTARTTRGGCTCVA